MARWTCPRCDREFGRARQPHTCVPGTTVGQVFAGRPAAFRAVYDEVVGEVRHLGPVHEDAVSVGVFLKAGRTVAEVRPRSRDVVLLIWLPRPLDDARARVLAERGGRVAHRVVLRTPADVDEDVRAWLAEAYHLASP